MSPLKEKNKLKITVSIIGYLGLLPFIITTFGMYAFYEQYYSILHKSLLLYSSLIISFLAAIYWGIVLTLDNSENSYSSLVFSVSPLILIYLINLFDFELSSIILFYLLLLNFIFLIEILKKKSTKIPNWYLKLRRNLNILLSIMFVLIFLKL